MVIRKKNLLEAFQASAPEGRAAERRGSDAQASAGGPFAPTAGAGAQGAQGARVKPDFPARARSSTWSRALSDRTVQVVLVLCVLAVAGASYWAGARRAAAAERVNPDGALLHAAAELPPVKPDSNVAAANKQTAQIGDVHARAFMDKANKFTLRLIQYGNDAAGEKNARATYEYLRKEGVPVVGPVAQGKVLLLCAGHEARTEDLVQMQAFVKGLRGPPPQSEQRPFASAYVVNIDDVVQR